MTATRAQILHAVNAEPAGITTAALAAKLGSARYNVGSTLSKLAAYGAIVKAPARQGAHGNGSLWCRRPAP